ncbi:MAG: hypothetical protein A3G18_13240 [Rhodospirillales bacterium RIFCSPLOWO2_12_FULL_58_28]|nr:MAG: hypothetical protein A3H92_13095 [Rhodospirillales bacterium RIFCSPLOWO2_02_FULL_58_16]OHC78543.1 MAG: hypothetical protein A3G18_13240 [Rhodospirillales bacterium RIFCSPLOWO2_12_FULL_58_28]
MAFFSKTPDPDKKPSADSKPVREHDRIEGKGEKVAILPSSKTFNVLDFSMGGFCIKGYDGKLHGNQYLEFKFFGAKDGKDVKTEGFATVVRAKDDFLAVKFTPQPRLKQFFLDYLD